MGGMKLSEFGGQTAKSSAVKTTRQVNSKAEPQPVEPPSQSPGKPKQDKAQSNAKAIEAPKQERLTTVNIKIPRSQHEWLTNTARQVRDNNEEPVAASDRVYPQHLIQIAVEMLKSSGVNWSEVRNADELRHALMLLKD